MKQASLQRLEEKSCEVALTCDAQGTLTWADARAVRRLGARPGQPLRALAPPGTEERVDALLAAAAAGPVEGWEVSLVAGERTHTFRFCAEPTEEGMALLGTLLPKEHGQTLEQLQEALHEVVNLNREVVRQKHELQRRHEELLRLHHELEESNRGVLALHAELEDKADALRQSAEVKGRVVSSVSHEFRTPLHSILGLTELLLHGVDGPLSSEQSRQVGFIRTSAQELVQLVNDLLDLSKLEAGRSALRTERFTLEDFVTSLRGAMRPLVPEGAAVRLLFEEPLPPLTLETDRGKLAQVVRNLLSNALKFTEKGEVRLRVGQGADGQLALCVQDSGIGIAPEHQERVFHEFTQLDSALQERTKGTGLGLPIARKLMELLGGTLTLHSTPGQGSTFTATLPLVHPEVQELQSLTERSRTPVPGRAPVLVVEDDRRTLFMYERYLSMAGFQVLPARSVEEARATLSRVRPAAVVLDIVLEGESSWRFLAELKGDSTTHDIPVLVVTVSNQQEKARALGADGFWLKPLNQEHLLKNLRALTRPTQTPRVLLIDDDETSRYLVRKYLEPTPFALTEAAGGEEGVRLAQQGSPHVILLDFLLQDGTAFDVLDELKADPATRAIPVIIITSHALDEGQRLRLAAMAEAVISKQNLTRELAIHRIRDALRKAGVGSELPR